MLFIKILEIGSLVQLAGFTNIFLIDKCKELNEGARLRGLSVPLRKRNLWVRFPPGGMK